MPPSITNDAATRIAFLSAQLSSPDNRFEALASEFDFEPQLLSMNERIELTAELNALVAWQYGLTSKELAAVLESFSGFKEDSSLKKLPGEIVWTEELVRKFNGEVRKRIPSYFDRVEAEGEGYFIEKGNR